MAGDVIILRLGKNTLGMIETVKAKSATSRTSLPEGVEIVPIYDWSDPIKYVVGNLTHKSIREFIVVAVVCLTLLLHLRSALMAIASLPLGILAALPVVRYQGVNTNTMSSGDITIVVGAVIDVAVMMVKDACKHLGH